MAAQARRRDPGVGELLAAEPYRFDFFQAVRLLKLFRLHRAGRVDADVEPEVRYRANLMLDFPASAIDNLEPPAELRPDQDGANAPPAAVMTINFLGLTGPLGVLPRHYTETLIHRRLNYRDGTARTFFDIFNDRMTELFYRVWAKYNFFVGLERNEGDGFSRLLLDIAGLGTAGLIERMRVSEAGLGAESAIYYSGLLSQRPHSAAAIRNIIGDLFGCPVTVDQCRGRWLHLDPANRTRLGAGPTAKLGVSTVIGDRVWDRQSYLRVRIGPLARAQFDRLLPDGPDFAVTSAVTRLLAGIGLDFDVQLVLRREEVPPCRMGTASVGGARLGWNSWIGTKPWQRDPDDAILPGERRQLT